MNEDFRSPSAPERANVASVKETSVFLVLQRWFDWGTGGACQVAIIAALGAVDAVGCQGASGQQTPSREPAPNPSVAVSVSPNGAPIEPADNAIDSAASVTTAMSTDAPVTPRGRRQFTAEQLEECVQSCGRIQQDHPEETPYDCRATCINGRISP